MLILNAKKLLLWHPKPLQIHKFTLYLSLLIVQMTLETLQATEKIIMDPSLPVLSEEEKSEVSSQLETVPPPTAAAQNVN